MKTINFELSKRLNKLWLLDNIETEYWIHKMYDWEIVINKEEWHKYISDRDIHIQWDWNNYHNYKTLTLEEAIEVLPWYIECKEWKLKWNLFDLHFWKYYIEYSDSILWVMFYFSWKTLLEVIEKMIEFLLEKKLLTK